MPDPRYPARGVEPLPDECLMGFGLRLDAASRFPCWTVARDSFASRSGVRTVTAAMWLAGNVWDFGYLSLRSGIAEDRLRELTLMPTITRLFPAQVVTIRALGSAPAIRICPTCWKERRLIRRTFFLPEIFGCPEHLVRLMERCVCGEGLMRSDGARGAPRCDRCRTPWDQLPADELSRHESASLTDLSVAWSLVLGLVGVNPRTSTLRVARARQLTTARRPAVPLETRQFANVSLSRLVTLLVALGVDDRLVGELLAADRPRPGCPNATCLYYEPLSEEDLPANERETHCHYCGSRFIGRRIISSFDLEHGSANGFPRPSTVRRAQRRLRIWRKALRRECARMLEQDETITVAAAFTAAHVPRRANLRATKLGLVDIVGDAIHEQRIRRRLLPPAFASLTLADYRELVATLRAMQIVGAAGQPLLHDRIGLRVADALLAGTLDDARIARQYRRPRRRPSLSPHQSPRADATARRRERSRTEELDRLVEEGIRRFPSETEAMRLIVCTREAAFPFCPHCGQSFRVGAVASRGVQRTCLRCLRLWGPVTGTTVARAIKKAALLRIAFGLAASSTSLATSEVEAWWQAPPSRALASLALLREVIGYEVRVDAAADPNAFQALELVRPASLTPLAAGPESRLSTFVPAHASNITDRLAEEFASWSRSAFRSAYRRQPYLDEWAFRLQHPEPEQRFDRLLVGLVRPRVAWQAIRSSTPAAL